MSPHALKRYFVMTYLGRLETLSSTGLQRRQLWHAVPIAQIGFLEQDQLRIRSTFGVAPTSVPRRGSFSACAICLHEDIFEVRDTRRDVSVSPIIR